MFVRFWTHPKDEHAKRLACPGVRTAIFAFKRMMRKSFAWRWSGWLSNMVDTDIGVLLLFYNQKDSELIINESSDFGDVKD